MTLYEVISIEGRSNYYYTVRKGHMYFDVRSSYLSLWQASTLTIL